MIFYPVHYHLIYTTFLFFFFPFFFSADLEEFFEGKGYLNKETGNFQQDANDFVKRGGHERFNYVGDDPRENDHYSTSDASYHGGEAILQFYTNEARSAFLDAPTADFQKGCNATNAAVCCWQRDRQVSAHVCVCVLLLFIPLY